jgi:hypothetical protein
VRVRWATPGVAAAVLLVGVTLSPVAYAAATASARLSPLAHAEAPSAPRVVIPPNKGQVLYGVKPLRGAPPGRNITNNTTVPTTAYSVKAGQDGNTYVFSTVGTNFTAGSATTNVPMELLPLKVTFTGTGDVYDPTSVNTGCGETISGVNAVESGAELGRRTWTAGGTVVAQHSQYVDAQIREEFWAWTNPHGSSPGYHVFLNPSVPTTYSDSESSYPEVNPGTCGEVGEIDMGYFDSRIQATLNGTYSSSSIPVFLVKNIVFTTNSGATCCIYGWHSSFVDKNGNTQTYAIASWLTDGYLGSTADLAPISHELAEWANDPFGNNPTPAWGHIGQQQNCQSNLEVGDPLSGTTFTVSPSRPGGGMTYHLQELAFAGWFYDANWGVHGWYSSKDTFKSGSTLCT